MFVLFVGNIVSRTCQTINMPNSNFHNAVCLVATIVFPVSNILVGNDPGIAFASGLGAATGILLTPDLDIRENKTQKNIWDLYWYPYSKAIPHRHFLSHFPFIGTICRVIYAFPLLFLGYFWLLEHNLFQYWLISLLLVDALHWTSDWITTAIKRAI